MFCTGYIQQAMFLLIPALLLNAVENTEIESENRYNSLVIAYCLLIVINVVYDDYNLWSSKAGLTTSASSLRKKAMLPFSIVQARSMLVLCVSLLLVMDRDVLLNRCGTQPLECLFGNLRRKMCYYNTKDNLEQAVLHYVEERTLKHVNKRNLESKAHVCGEDAEKYNFEEKISFYCDFGVLLLEACGLPINNYF